MICNSCNMSIRDLPIMYAQSPRTIGLRDEGIPIRQIKNAHVTCVMQHFHCHSNNINRLNATSNCHTCL